jgi:hypothetical protein
MRPRRGGVTPGIGRGVPGAGVSGAVPAEASVIVFRRPAVGGRPFLHINSAISKASQPRPAKPTPQKSAIDTTISIFIEPLATTASSPRRRVLTARYNGSEAHMRGDWRLVTNATAPTAAKRKPPCRHSGLKSREETPKEGAGRRVMPHCSNILVAAPLQGSYFSSRTIARHGTLGAQCSGNKCDANRVIVVQRAFSCPPARARCCPVRVSRGGLFLLRS